MNRAERLRGLVVPVVLVIVAVVIVVLWALGGRHHAASNDQCSKPVSQRVGGWVCPN